MDQQASGQSSILADGWDRRRAPLGRRVAALCVDWAACWAVTIAFRLERFALVPLGIFFLENVLFVGALGFTLGHRLLGLHVVRLDGGPAGFFRSLQRTFLLCLVLPAVVWDADGRALHDRAAGTAIVRIRTSAVI